ncbi:hypothetical protein [Nonomuraea aurantiaca]|uniref:hypothetical protein n=1 Tax=Nonomuraea aurantiaca TaxID=2878562 RepID=UPI001CDA341F|nr:hypothetical protein [Nonomuraea aurantiaca]MCA2223517.1 hypothetical protein [Nonomuraea aurantiaca]
MLAGIRDHVLMHHLAIADPDEVAAAVQTITRHGATGEAWTVQAGRPPAPVTFPAVDLSGAG